MGRQRGHPDTAVFLPADVSEEARREVSARVAKAVCDAIADIDGLYTVAFFTPDSSRLSAYNRFNVFVNWKRDEAGNVKPVIDREDD